MFAAVLAPMLLGVLYYGLYFWKLQHVPVLDPNIDQSGIVGTYCIGEIPDLLTRVREASLVAAENVNEGVNGTDQLPLSLADIAATVVSYTPNTLGLLVTVSFTTNVIDEIVPFLPLPNDGNVVTSSQLRLQNVKITSGSC